MHLQLNEIETKEFSLMMNLSNTQPPDRPSDITIGRIKTDQFQLNINKTDQMNLQVHQVDSETAELFFDDRFCMNDSDIDINLNLSKNGNNSMEFDSMGIT